MFAQLRVKQQDLRNFRIDGRKKLPGATAAQSLLRATLERQCNSLANNAAPICASLHRNGRNFPPPERN